MSQQAVVWDQSGATTTHSGGVRMRRLLIGSFGLIVIVAGCDSNSTDPRESGSDFGGPAKVVALPGGVLADYPLDGDATDRSGNGYHGTVTGAVAGVDRFGIAGMAMSFDGLDDEVVLPGAPTN